MKLLSLVLSMLMLMLVMFSMPAYADRGEKEVAKKVGKALFKESFEAVAKHPEAVAAPLGAHAGKTVAAPHLAQTAPATSHALSTIIGSVAIATPFVALFVYDYLQGYKVYEATGVWPSAPAGYAWDSCANATYGTPTHHACVQHGLLTAHHRH